MTKPGNKPARKLHLVQFSSDRNGSTISGLSLANGLKDRGWKVDVVFSHSGPMEEVYRSCGFSTRVVEHKSWLRRSNPFRFTKDLIVEWSKARRFEKLIEDIQPDIVYINTSVSLAAAVAAKRQGIKVIWHLRELFADVGGEMKAPAMGRPLVRWVLRHLSDSLVANSRAVAMNLLGANGARNAMVVPNAISESSFESELTAAAARQKLGLPQNVPIIGVPGTLRAMKGHEFFFNSVVELPDRHPDILFAITGNGDASFVARLKAQVGELGLEQRVIFLGVLDGLTTFYRACDVICVPSRAEPFGRVVIEAFAAGATVIATAVGGIAEIIDDQVNGLLVPYGDKSALLSGIDQLLDDEPFRARLAENAYIKAREKFPETKYQETISSLAKSLI